MSKTIEELKRALRRAKSWDCGHVVGEPDPVKIAQRALDDALMAEAVRSSAEYFRIHQDEPNEAKE